MLILRHVGRLYYLQTKDALSYFRSPRLETEENGELIAWHGEE